MLRNHALLAALTLAGVVAACGSSSESTFGNGNDQEDGGAGSGTPIFNPGSSGGDGTSGGVNPTGTLRVDPPVVTLTATGTLADLAATQTFSAHFGTEAAPVTANWSVDDAGIGTIGSDGLFRTSSFAGKTRVRARVGNLEGFADVTVKFKIQEDLASGLDDAKKTALKVGGNADVASFRWLYPYDKTVFPRGLLPPKLMFGGANATGYYVHLQSGNVEYEGFYPGGSGPSRITVSEAWWKAITRSAGASDPVKVDVTKIEGTKVTGPISETWTIAQGSLKGTVFYNTYNSKLVRAAGAIGAVMRLKPGSNVEVFIGKTTTNTGTGGDKTTTCTVCHSVSANGTALAAGLDWGDNGSPYQSAVFSISTTGAATPRFALEEGRAMPFGAFSPDGNWLVGSASPFLRGLSGDFPSRLYDAKTGLVVNDTFFGTRKVAVTPSFSPDGKLLAYSDRDANGSGRQISILNADLAASPPSFSGLTALATSGTKVLGWPSFLPDSKGVLYQEGSAYDTAGGRDGKAQLRHFCGELQWADVATKVTKPLDSANGYNADGSCYLPFCTVPDPDIAGGDASVCNTEDAHMNYEPTVLPVAVGGYYWAVFTSRRAYGNFLYRGTGSVTPSGDVPFDNSQDGNDNVKGFRKKLWVAAIDINGQPATDISHPAFLLEGQETEAGNMRGFWALDPCRANGDACEGGDECCGGFCRQVTSSDGKVTKACVPPPTGCANETEKCSVAADCCTAAAGTSCVNGFCTIPTPGGPR